MRLPHGFLASFVALALGACSTTPPPTYRHSQPALEDAAFSFESDYELHTHFSVNTQRGASCGKFETVGYLLKPESIFLYDKANREINVQVPSRRLVGVGGYHYFSDPSFTSSCYPGSHFFVPEPRAKYVVKMNRTETQSSSRRSTTSASCSISVLQISDNGSRKPVDTFPPPPCSK